MEQEASLKSRPSRTQRRILNRGFRATAICGLLIGIITLIGQIAWHVERPKFSTFELEICFGIYGLFLASTSYYLSEIQAGSWARFHLVVSVIGVGLDIILIIYHISSPLNIEDLRADIFPETIIFKTLENIVQMSKKNDRFMISMAGLQTANNLIAIFLCLKIIRGPGTNWRGNDREETTISLLQLPQTDP